jgi:chromosomal replication initiation ATPase DnaA
MLQPYYKSGVPVARQRKILETIKENPLASYVFSGPPGVGKTTIMREVERLARAACPKNFAVYSKAAPQYQRDVTTAARGERVTVVNPNSLDNDYGIRWGIFLDDIDKITGSEFIRLQLFDLLNAVTKERTPTTQLVLTTNTRKDEFLKFFGDAIAWRVFKHCLWVSMEREP